MIKIPMAQPSIGKRAEKYLLQCLQKNWLSQGEFNTQFEGKLSEVLNVSYVSACVNGTLALWLALKAVGVGEGDEVVVPTFTFSASASAVVMAGAKPMFIDVNEDDFTMSVSALEEALSAKGSKIKAIMPVHLYGLPARMEKIMALAKKYNCAVVEDAAEAFHVEYRGKKLGTIGDVGCFSFYANKIITTGEGGACVTNSREIFDRIHQHKNHGSGKQGVYWSEVSGTNARMTNMQAAVGVSQLEDLEKILKARRIIYANYIELLAGLEKSVLIPKVIQKDPHGAHYSPWVFMVRMPGFDKDEVVKALAEAGVDARGGFHPCHAMPAFSKYVKKGQAFSVAEKVAREIVSLPTFVGITKAQQRTVVAELKKIIGAQK